MFKIVVMLVLKAVIEPKSTYTQKPNWEPKHYSISLNVRGSTTDSSKIITKETERKKGGRGRKEEKKQQKMLSPCIRILTNKKMVKKKMPSPFNRGQRKISDYFYMMKSRRCKY